MKVQKSKRHGLMTGFRSIRDRIAVVPTGPAQEVSKLSKYCWAKYRDNYFSFGNHPHNQFEGPWRNFIITGFDSEKALYKAKLLENSPPKWYEKRISERWRTVEF